MLAKVYSAATFGLAVKLVEVEVDLEAGLHCFQIVGLGDKAIQEAKDRVSSAIKNCGFTQPQHSRKRVIVNLAPADLKKQGPAYDLPIAAAFLLASQQIDSSDKLAKSLFIGELSLDGRVRPVNGALAIADLAQKKNFQTLFLPRENALEAGLIKGLEIIPVACLDQLINHLKGERMISPVRPTKIKHFASSRQEVIDMAYVKGQQQAKRALEIAAAGGHNLIFTGLPGTGKTLLARALPGILPDLTLKEVLEVSKIFSVAGLLSADYPLVVERPFRAPHHTASAVSLIGGGTIPKPGEITLAHRGVLFLDELPEFGRQVLESLRQPLEDGLVTVSRAQGSLVFPAKFILIGAANPCPCGKLGDVKETCLCSPRQISNYQRRLSGPFLDRIDLHLEVPKISYQKLSDQKMAETSALIKKRVSRARGIQQKRFRTEKNIYTNAEMNLKQIKNYCLIDKSGKNLLNQAVNSMNLSPRAYYRILKLSRTIADLEDSQNILAQHLAEAIQYRPKTE